MKLLALDIASATGFAFGNVGDPAPIFGERHMAPDGANEGFVFDNFERWLRALIFNTAPEYAFAEDQFIGKSRMVAQRLFGMRAICAMVCHREGIRLRWVQTQTVQQFVTGRGTWPKGQKKAAMDRACKSLGFKPQTDNQSDAIGVWLLAEHALSPVASQRRFLMRETV